MGSNRFRQATIELETLLNTTEPAKARWNAFQSDWTRLSTIKSDWTGFHAIEAIKRERRRLTAIEINSTPLHAAIGYETEFDAIKRDWKLLNVNERDWKRLNVIKTWWNAM